MRNIKKLAGTKIKVEQHLNQWMSDSEMEEVDEDIVVVPEELSVQPICFWLSKFSLELVVCWEKYHDLSKSKAGVS